MENADQICLPNGLTGFPTGFCLTVRKLILPLGKSGPAPRQPRSFRLPQIADIFRALPGMFFPGKKWMILLAVIGLSLGAGTAQNTPFSIQPIDTRGPNASAIMEAAEDSSGMIWGIAWDGLWRYDGSLFERYAAAKDSKTGQAVSLVRMISIRCSSVQPHWLWLGGRDDGLWGLNLRTGQVDHYPYDLGNDDSPGGGRIIGMTESKDDGTLWLASDNFTLTRFDGQHFKRFVPPAFPQAPNSPADGGLMGNLAFDARDQNLLWIGSRYGLYRFDRRREQFAFFPFPAPLPLFYEGIPVTLLPDEKGYVWAGANTPGLMRLDPSTGAWKIVPIEADNPVPVPKINSIHQLDAERLLIGFEPRKFWIYNVVTDSSDYMTPNTGASGASVVLIRYRKNAGKGPTWLVRATAKLYQLTMAPGLSHFERFKNRCPAITRNNWQRAYCMSPDRRYQFLGTLNGDGLLRWDWARDTMFIIPYKAAVPADSIKGDILYDDLFFDPDGQTLWVGTDHGLMQWQEGWPGLRRPGFATSPEMRNYHINALFADAQNIWLGTDGHGIFLVDKATGNINPLFPPESALMQKTLKVNRFFLDTQKTLWIGSDEGLLGVSLQGEVKEQFFPANAEGEALSSGSKVMDIREDALGNLWIGAYGALYRYKLHAPPGLRLSSFHNRQSILSNYINAVLITQQGLLWLGTEDCLSVFDPADGSFVDYGESDGFLPRMRLFSQWPDGRIITGANGGVLMSRPEDFRRSSEPPQVYWREFRIFDRLSEQSVAMNTLSELLLRAGQNHFSFTFGALNFEESAQNNFAYRLEGYDKDWVSSGDRTYASYTNLAPGLYTFWVKAANRYGQWSAPRGIGVRILPPFWQTGWFRMLALAALVALGWQLWRLLRERQRNIQSRRIIAYFANTEYTGHAVEEILWDITRSCVSLFNFHDFTIYLKDQERGLFIQKTLYGGKNTGPEILANPLVLQPGQGVVGSVAATGLPEIVPDTRRDPRYLADNVGGRSEITVPIIHNGEVIGVMDSEHSLPHFYNAHHLHVLQSVANLCGAKIVKAESEEAMRRKEAELRELDRKLAESELTALKAQMNPHFLFNCLNSINWYIIKNRPLDASKYLTKFSRLIRLILDNSKHQKISLAEEIEALRLYIEMEAIRFEEKFHYDFLLDDELDPGEVKVPPMILQPYVENAIWHGLMHLERPGHLRIALRREGAYLHCVIEDNGIGRTASRARKSAAVGERESKGMEITAHRIALLNKADGSEDLVRIVDLYDEKENPAGTKVELRLPVEEE